MEKYRHWSRNGYLWMFYSFLRIQKPITKILGRKYRRTPKIQINITYACNCRCINCSKSLRLSPSNTKMTIEQINKFIDESIKKNIKWEIIDILGGEPTLHPDILIILNKLLEYKNKNSPKTRIRLATNGSDKIVNKVLGNVPKEVDILNTKKNRDTHFFYPINDAPIDSVKYKFADYSNGCIATEICGIGLDPWGYYPCVVAGSIDRIFGFDLGRRNLPNEDDFMTEQLNAFCKLCGAFKYCKTTRKEKVSPTWKKAFESYHIDKPKLSLY